MAAEQAGDGDAPAMSTLFELCNDVREMQAFYSDVIGLTETFFNAEKGWLTYQAGPVQIVFTHPTATPLAPTTEWSRSPGWDGGTLDAPSWVLQVAPDAFDRLLDRLPESMPRQTRTSDDGTLREVFLMDPMGRTVEIYSERPMSA